MATSLRQSNNLGRVILAKAMPSVEHLKEDSLQKSNY